jgi:hypothetical protein
VFMVLLPLLRRPGGSLSASKFLTNGVRKIMYSTVPNQYSAGAVLQASWCFSCPAVQIV